MSDIIYSALEQSCNVLNYTKLSELVDPQKEWGPGVSRGFFCLLPLIFMAQRGKMKCLDSLRPQEVDLVESHSKAGMRRNRFHSLGHMDISTLFL